MLDTGNGQGLIWHVACHGGARRNKGLVANLNWRDNVSITADKGLVTYGRTMLLLTVIVDEDSPATDIDITT